MKFDILHNFISPVTGYILANPNYVPYGNRGGIAVPSPIIIDIRLDLLNLKKRYDTSSNADFVIGHYNSELPNAQILSNIQNGYIYNNNGTVSTSPQIPLCYAASTSNLTYSYDNGQANDGVGATLTNTTLGPFSIDGISPPINSNILIKDQLTTFQNGIYVLTNIGDNTTETVLTRSPSYNMAYEIQSGGVIIVQYGTLNNTTFWIETQNVTTIGVDPILFIHFSPFNILPQNNIWIGNSLNQPAANPTIYLNNLPSLTNKNIWRGDVNNRPVESDSLTNDERQIGNLFTDLNDLTSAVNNVVNTVKGIQSILNGATGLLAIPILLAGLSVLQIQVFDNDGDINRIKYTLGKYYPKALSNSRLFVDDTLDKLLLGLANLKNYTETLTLYKISYYQRNDGDVNINNFKLINVGDPYYANDAVNKRYVDQLSVLGMSGQINVNIGFVNRIGPHNFTLSLSPTGVAAGTYLSPAVTVDAYGRITHIGGGTGILTLTGDVTGIGDINSPIATTLKLNLNEIAANNVNTADVDMGGYKLINLKDPTNPQDAVTLSYLENSGPGEGNLTLTGDVTGTGPNNSSNYVTTLNITLDAISTGATTKPIGNVSINNFKIITLADPIDDQDAVNYRTLKRFTPGGGDNLTLTGDVTGFGPNNSTNYITSLNVRLNSISTGDNTKANSDVSINDFKIINLADPISPLDAVNLQTLQRYTPGGGANLTLTGAIIGTGPNNSSDFVTTFTLNLNEISIANPATDSIDANNQKIINLLNPTNPQDAVTLSYLDTYIPPFNLNLNEISILYPTTGDVDFNMFRLINLADSTSQYDGVNYNTLWELINWDDFYTNYINPELKILGPLQQFNFDINNSGLQLSNSFIATNLINSNTNLEFSNSNLSGYRVRQETTSNSNSGNLYFEQYTNSTTTGNKYFGIDSILQETVFYKDGSMNNNSLRDVGEMPTVLDTASENNAVSFAFLFKLLNDEII